MNSNSRSVLSLIQEALLMTAVALAVLFAGKAEAAQFSLKPSLTPAITNNTVLRGTNATTTLAGPTNTVFSGLAQGKYLGLAATLGSTNATTSNVVFTVEFSLDGTNFLTAPTADFTLALNGTGSARGETNFPLHVTANFATARLKSFGSSTALQSFWVTNVFFVTSP